MATWLSAPIWTQLEDEESFTATALAFNRRGTLAAAGTREGECCIYDTSTIVVRLRELDGVAGGAVTHLAFSCDSRFLAVADSGGTLALWDLAANVVARTFRDLAVANLCFHPDDAAVLLVSRWDAPPVLLDVSPGATEATHPPRTLRLADPYADADADAGTEGAEGDVGAEGGVGGGAGGLLEVGAGAEASKKKKKRKPLPMGSLEHHAIFSSNGRRITGSSSGRRITSSRLHCNRRTRLQPRQVLPAHPQQQLGRRHPPTRVVQWAWQHRPLRSVISDHARHQGARDDN